MTKISQLLSIGDSLAIDDQFIIRDVSDVSTPNKSVTISGITRALDLGSAAAPAIAFASDKNSGLYSPGADQVAISTNGTGRLAVSTTAVSSTLAVDVPLGAAATPSITFTGDLNTGIYSPGADQLAISIAGSGKIFIDSTGKLGVGISSPAASTTNYSVDVYGPVLARAAIQAHQTNAGVFEYSGNETKIRSYGATSNTGSITFSTGGGGGSADSERLRITADGKVGIGTSSPTAVFHAVVSSAPGTSNADGVRINAGGNVAINMGANSSVGYGWIQSANWGSGYIATAINPNGGNVGIGTTSPDVNFVVSNGGTSSSASSGTLARVVGSGVSRLDIVGGNSNYSILEFSRANLTAAGQVAYEHSSNSLYFSVNGASEKVRIDSSGRLLVGTSTDGGAGGLTIYPAGSGAGSAAIGVWNKTNTALEAAAQFRVSGTTIGSISYSNTLVAYNTTSDYRLKENVTPITNGITRFQQLKPSKFNFIVEPDKTVEGFLAHEAQAVVPECVTGEKDAVDADGNPVYQGIDQSKLVPLLTAALQEAIAEINALKDRLTAAGIA